MTQMNYLFVNTHAGIWNSKEELENLQNGGKVVFFPQELNREMKMDKYRQWVEACHRFKHWHNGRQ